MTVEWEGTGPDKSRSNIVSKFKCKIDDKALQNCEYMNETNGDNNNYDYNNDLNRCVHVPYSV